MLAIVGGLFVVEAWSVIIQVAYFATGRRVFLMAPIHHHFEKGWAEPQIVIRFWIISLILVDWSATLGQWESFVEMISAL